jgi:hypothetical protein
MFDLVPAYSSAKTSLGAMLGASEDLLHVHAGLLIFFAAALLFRRRMRSRIPVGLVWLFALANELFDAFAPMPSPSKWEVAADVVNTVFWPTLLFLLARRRGAGQDPNQTA